MCNNKIVDLKKLFNKPEIKIEDKFSRLLLIYVKNYVATFIKF